MLTLLLLLTGSYTDSVAELERARVSLAAEVVSDEATRAQRRERARRTLFLAIVDELLPAWYGTDWDFNGTTTTPRSGKIACGYLVTTVMEHAGLRLPRAKLAQQASEKIVRSLVVGDGPVLRFRDRPAADVVAAARAHGDSIWAVGLDLHAGLLVVDTRHDRVSFCHASFLDDAKMLCEPALTSAGFASRYRVIGKLFDDAAVDRWLAGAAFPLRS